MAKQISAHFKIPSDGGASGPSLLTKQNIEDFKIRSVSDGSAWGWGPTRIK